MNVVSGDNVAVHYKGNLGDGSVFDSSEGREPLSFTVGAGEVIPGFEQAVVGLEPGQSTTVTIAPEDAYGPRYEEAVQEAPREMFGEREPAVGDAITVVAQDGNRLPATIAGVSDDGETVVLDFNHPLAGQTLTFEIELVEIAERAE